MHELSASPPSTDAISEFPPVGGLTGSHITTMTRVTDGYSAPLVARAHLRVGLWTWVLNVSTSIPSHNTTNTTYVHPTIYSFFKWFNNNDKNILRYTPNHSPLCMHRHYIFDTPRHYCWATCRNYGNVFGWDLILATTRITPGLILSTLYILGCSAYNIRVPTSDNPDPI